MGSVLHGSARTTPRIRAELQASKESGRALAARYGLNAKTVDGGETWRELAVADDKALIEYGVAFIGARHGWVGGDPIGYETRDGGLTWRPAHMGVAVNKIRILPKADGGLRLFSVGKEVWRLDLPPGS